MSNWVAKVKFRDLLKEFNVGADDELEEVQRVMPLWIERFKNIPQLSHFVKSLKKVKTESGFNRWLDIVYDYCDSNSIWVEF